MEKETTALIGRMVADIEKKELELADLKRTVNSVCIFEKLPPRYTDVDAATRSSSGQIRRDQFHGVPQATAVREYLTMRGDSKAGGLGAATVNEIFEALKTGGFRFDVKNDENAKRGLRISLTKNSTTFYRLPNGTYGLLEWYPNIREPRPDQSEHKGTEAKAEPAPELDDDINPFGDDDDPEETATEGNPAAA